MKSIGRLEVVSFMTGFCLMTFELAAARVLAPSVGSSTYVWTSVIGVIIAALSLGYYAGGILADKRGYSHDVSWLLLGASTLVMLTTSTYPDVLDTIAGWYGVDVRIQAVVAALILFAPASFILGMISPYLAKLNVRSLSSSGRSIASLSALNSIGGIVGTFVTGFILFGYVGSKETITLVAILLISASWLPEYRHRLYTRLGITVLVVLVSLASLLGANNGSLASVDTASAHYEVQELSYRGTKIRGILTGPDGVQSAINLDGSKQPVFWYTQTLADLTLAEQPRSVLVLGGGTFTLPEYLAIKLPEATIDVVEIDPKLEEISKAYFNFEPRPNLNLMFEDARTFVNQSKKTYDVIIADVYNDGTIPFSLATREYGSAVAARTKPGGVVLANVIGGLTGPCRAVLDAVNNAYAQDFWYSSYITSPGSDERRANVITRYSRSDNSLDRGLHPIANEPARAYGDNFAPLERLYYNCRSIAT